MDFFKYMPLDECINIVLVGFSIVFLILIFLVIFFSILGKIVSTLSKDKGNGGNDDKKKIDLKETKSSPSGSPAVDNGMSDEVVAVIAAAVAAMSAADGKKYAVRSIRPSRSNGRPVWAMAGLYENTASF